MRPILAVWAALIVAATGGLFRISYSVGELDQELATINREISREREAIRVLSAEWSYLNQPARLRDLAIDFTALVPVHAGQIVTSLDQIPMPLAEVVAQAGQGGGDANAALTADLQETPPLALRTSPPRRPRRAVVSAFVPRRDVAPQAAGLEVAGTGDALTILLAGFRSQQVGQ